ncbi:COX15/CtaA family protein [Falsiroseomonas selenitidurans]|uniref:Heme A synthase n=1 Tax=Falsiroseomonas selenitidurans TaxID=2716335 RepID=A0ABX1DX40_9PROT|nr:COX15/CtaA family protein [Falsiroseomonas selenitidurans]NKC29454.1 heme A synthase [Falsiroseomonas selenitidurans]
MPFDPPAPLPAATRHAQARAVATWLLFVAGLVWIMVAIGGATRLTGSGLSIMEWAPLSGTLPPLSEAEWQRLYDLYRTIPQYALVNQGFGLEGFKEIFWLEWIHRFWGRLIGLAYAAGLAWFWLRGRIPPGSKPRLLGLLALGGLQGAIGWYMVASGFEADRTAVSPYRLVIHLGLALAIFAALVWTALGLLRPAGTAPAAARPVRRMLLVAAWALVGALLAGGFVAGIRAGLSFNTFPLMDGQLVPDGYWLLSPAWTNLTSNVAAVQFNHRLLATLTLLCAAGAVWAALRRLPAGGARGAVLGFGAAVALQYTLGVVTLLHVVPVSLGTLHQAVAVLVLGTALVALHALRPAAPPSP